MSPQLMAVVGVLLTGAAIAWWRSRITPGVEAANDEWIRQVLGSDREVAEVARALRRVAREHRQSS